MRSQHERAVLTAAVLTVLTAQYRLASWTWSRKVPAEQAVIEAEVANGWHLRYNALPSTLAEAERSAFALVPDATYLTPDVPTDEWYHSNARSGCRCSENYYLPKLTPPKINTSTHTTRHDPNI